MDYGPTLPVSEEVHKLKYRGEGESFKEAMARVANALKDNDEHFLQLKDILYNMRFLPAGRIQSAMGAPKEVTPYNCFVSQPIEDSMASIMRGAERAAETLRMGGGIGYDFSRIRPRGALIKSLDSQSSGPISFMGIYDSVCATISSAGHRRGAQMGILRVDHPDIEEFIHAKNNTDKLTNFNVSIAVTDEFMAAVEYDEPFDLKFEGKAHKTVNARALWDKIMRSTWDWAEPGIIFIDRINKKNNLWYCETIEATNPCGEQPLPANGACLLGSFNLTKYVTPVANLRSPSYVFDYDQFKHDIPIVVRAIDNVIDRATYPLEEQLREAHNKRRMGLGVTGVANAIEAIGYTYGSTEFLETLAKILKVLRDTAYRTSVELAIEKGPFPLFSTDLLESKFAQTLPEDIRRDIATYGLRNSHLLSIAPTGTISLTADNISSGIEPVFSLSYDRKINTPTGQITERVEDYGYRVFGVKGKTADQLTPLEHVSVLNVASKFVDSSVSKTCNVGEDVTWDEFKNIYREAYVGGSSGCTTFRAAGKRFGILTASAAEDVAEEPEAVEDGISEGGACYMDPETGLRSCE